VKLIKVLRIFICLLILGILLSPFHPVVASSRDELTPLFQEKCNLLPIANPTFSDKDREEKIIEAVMLYFDARYKNFVGLIDNNYVESFTSAEISDSSWIALEKLRSKTIEKINASFYLPYDKYEFDLSISEVTFDGNFANVVLEEKAKITYKDPAILPLQFTRVYHDILLFEDANGWKVINDNYEDFITIQIKNRSEKEIFSTIEGNIVNQKRDSEFPSPQPVETPPTNFINLTYNRTAAVNYANTWKNGVNPSFWQESQDCTNFVSQAVYAGTNQVMSTPNDYYNKWYFDSYTKTGSLWRMDCFSADPSRLLMW
jgi:hypothetical protein